MPDGEKVIKALECRKNADKRCENPCEETGMCHYATAVRDINGEIYRPFICDRERICTDALALLKEQGTKTGKWIEQEVCDGDVYYNCSVCGESWVTIEGTPQENGMLYCPHCGAKMEGR